MRPKLRNYFFWDKFAGKEADAKRVFQENYSSI